jgi:hypothetical protein
MSRVSKRINCTVIAVLLSAFVVQSAFAAAKTAKGSYFESLGRKIIRVLDTINIRLPPG